MTNVDKDPVIEMCRAIEDYFGDADRTFPEAIALLVSAARERDQLVSAGSEPNLTADQLIAAGGTPPNGYFIRGSDAEGWSVALTIAGPEIWRRRVAAVSEAHAHAVRGRRYDPVARQMTACHADDDGRCTHLDCPQLRDDEPAQSGRHCPRDPEGSPS